MSNFAPLRAPLWQGLRHSRVSDRLRGLVTCGLAAMLALLVSVALNPALADGGGFVSEIKGGVLAHDVPDLWSGFQLETDAPDINVEVIFARYMPFLGGRLHPALGASINTGGGTSHAYLDARWQFDLTPSLFIGLGIGAAVHDGETGPTEPDMKALGSRLLFHFPVEVGFRLDPHNSISVYFEHISNGYTQDVNEGLDRLGVRYGYRF